MAVRKARTPPRHGTSWQHMLATSGSLDETTSTSCSLSSRIPARGSCAVVARAVVCAHRGAWRRVLLRVRLPHSAPQGSSCSPTTSDAGAFLPRCVARLPLVSARPPRRLQPSPSVSWKATRAAAFGVFPASTRRSLARPDSRRIAFAFFSGYPQALRDEPVSTRRRPPRARRSARGGVRSAFVGDVRRACGVPRPATVSLTAPTSRSRGSGAAPARALGGLGIDVHTAPRPTLSRPTSCVRKTRAAPLGDLLSVFKPFPRRWVRALATACAERASRAAGRPRHARSTRAG